MEIVLGAVASWIEWARCWSKQHLYTTIDKALRNGEQNEW